jgi:ubiquinone/menaquinone biosynthesis C-methylase UbiE
LEAVGCDPDPRALDRARRKSNAIRFEQGYAERLPYADGEFDRVLSSMMLHHVNDDAKTVAAAEVFRVLRPGGRLHVVDIGGDTTTDHGLMARLIRRNHHAAGNLGDAIPRLLRGAGFDCTEVATQPHRILGRLNYYRATRPA